MNGFVNTTNGALDYNVMPYVFSAVQNNEPYLENYLPSLEQIIMAEVEDGENHIDFWSDIPNGVYARDDETQVFVSQE